MRTYKFPLRLFVAAALLMTSVLPAAGHNAQAPDWMHALVNVPLPAHDEKDNAVLLYRNENLTVVDANKFRRTVQIAYKILRSEGRDYGIARVWFDSMHEKVTSIKAWCIPVDAKDYEVTEKDAVEVSPTKDMTEELITDRKMKALKIPAPDPGNIVGYEYVVETKPYVLQDAWTFQEPIPVRESHYSVTLPGGWEYKSNWANYPESKAQEPGGGQADWTVSNVKRIRNEPEMPSFEGIAGHMVITFFPPGGAAGNSLPTWTDVGRWENNLTAGRSDPSVEIRQKVQEITTSDPTLLEKMQVIAKFVQTDIRYVAIELGIGGWQPHPASEIFSHRYGDCKDKATLVRSMLQQIGVKSLYVDINTERGTVTRDSPADEFTFNHVIVAIQLPDSLQSPSLMAVVNDPALGRLLFFDPTNERIPFGQIGSYLQANFGLVDGPSGGELVKLPQQAPTSNGILRTANLALSSAGILTGSVHEERLGDRAWQSRDDYSQARKAADRVKPLEELLSDSLSSYQIQHASITNPNQTDLPFIWDYTIKADNYAKFAGDMLLVRPRVLGHKEKGILETPEPRRYDIEFDDGPVLDTDTFEITLPQGYVVDDIPAPIDVDYEFASYHSKTELVGNVLRYHRTFEEKELSVPVSKADQLKKLYRIIASDERNTAVLKLAAR